MGAFMIFIFIVAPLLELWLLFEVAGRIGGLMTVTEVILTAILGVSLLKWQSRTILARAQKTWQPNGLAMSEIVEGLLLAFGGLLLLIPGLVTDCLGLALLLPPIRRRLALGLAPYGKTFFNEGAVGSMGFSFFESKISRTHRTWQGGHIYEGEVMDRDDTAANDVVELPKNMEKVKTVEVTSIKTIDDLDDERGDS
ncbi:MAG: FxsA family protein [Gammaproteobacteria bacterium]